MYVEPKCCLWVVNLNQPSLPYSWNTNMHKAPHVAGWVCSLTLCVCVNEFKVGLGFDTIFHSTQPPPPPPPPPPSFGPGLLSCHRSRSVLCENHNIWLEKGLTELCVCVCVCVLNDVLVFYVGEEVLVTLGKQKDRARMKTKTKMPAIKLNASLLHYIIC